MDTCCLSASWLGSHNCWGLASGIRVGKILDRLHNNPYTILSTMVIALLPFQPFIGFIHHRRFMVSQKSGPWTHMHIWYDRLLILLGIINEGLGLRLAGNTRAGTSAYGVIIGLVGVTYYTMVAMFEARNGGVHMM
ncbi:hypothetical protein EMCG_03960 [[Emmonsia] crescens]|uniref:Uncharacterized protein n=1 Tax=[Emmonsia] crescens TaxID=73230 RepID=A0A0G2IZF4_9EURO|nr:hypothetical protein EMCG_03960 [Emmonsia crescens UAMH 3008]